MGRVAHARRAHRTGHAAPPRGGSQGRRCAAQPRTVGRGRHPGGRDRAGIVGQRGSGRLARRLCRLSLSGGAGPLGAGRDRAHALRPAPADAHRSGGAGRGDGGGGRGLAGGGSHADRRHQLLCRGDRLQAGPHQPGLEPQEPLLAARRGPAGEVASSRRSSGGFRRAAHRAAVDRAGLLDRPPGAAGSRRLWPPAGRRLAALRLVGHRLPGGVAEPRVEAEDEPPGHAR